MDYLLWNLNHKIDCVEFELLLGPVQFELQ